MSLETKRTLSLILLGVSILAWIARRAGLFYIPGLTAFSLAAAMLLLGTAMLRVNREKKLLPVLVVAFGVFNVLVGALELYSYFKG